RVRKSGYKVAFTPYAQCMTDVPTAWKALVKQRLRWERSGTIRHHCRKHIDMAYFWSPGFRWLDFLVLIESWFFNLVCMVGIWVWIVWLCLHPIDGWGHVLLTLYLCYLVFEAIHVLSAFYSSNHLASDAGVCL